MVNFDDKKWISAKNVDSGVSTVCENKISTTKFYVDLSKLIFPAQNYSIEAMICKSMTKIHFPSSKFTTWDFSIKFLCRNAHFPITNLKLLHQHRQNIQLSIFDFWCLCKLSYITNRLSSALEILLMSLYWNELITHVMT